MCLIPYYSSSVTFVPTLLLGLDHSFPEAQSSQMELNLSLS